MEIKGYYRFIAPAFLAKQGLPITKENIELEAKRLQELEKGIIINLIEEVVFTNDFRTAQRNDVINYITSGGKYEIVYTIGESGEQVVQAYVVDSNGILCLSSNKDYIDGIMLIGDNTNSINLYVYTNSKDMVGVNNGSLFILTTLGNYSYDMPQVKILSITRA